MVTVNSGMKFAWDEVPGATAYDVEVLNAAMGAVLASRPDLTVLEVTVLDICAGLAIGPTYNIHVRAKDAFGVGLWSNPLTFQILGPTAPGNLRAE